MIQRVGNVRVIIGDCRETLQPLGPFDMLLADPPYGDTALTWDKRCEGWIARAASLVKPTGCMWVFGSMRMFQDVAQELAAAGWKYAQDIVWEKQNGSGFAVDRFKRVHEHVCQFYRASAMWRDVYNDVQRLAYFGPDKHARARASRQSRTPHTGQIGPHDYQDDGTRIMRSVISMKNRHGKALHPTEKPSDLIEILIRTSCPPEGVIADLFAGSGSAGEAAMRCGRRYVGSEIDAEMAVLANDRLSQLLPLATQ